MCCCFVSRKGVPPNCGHQGCHAACAHEYHRADGDWCRFCESPKNCGCCEHETWEHEYFEDAYYIHHVCGVIYDCNKIYKEHESPIEKMPLLLVNRRVSEEFRALRHRYITARPCGCECVSAFLQVAKRSQIHHIQAIRVFRKMEDFDKERQDNVSLSRLPLDSFDSIRVIQGFVVDKEKRTLLDEVEVGRWKRNPRRGSRRHKLHLEAWVSGNTERPSMLCWATSPRTRQRRVGRRRISVCIAHSHSSSFCPSRSTPSHSFVF
jgi:hypothetical protein